ncbi:MAG: Glu-tRNA(Gln) amidotransferase GatDE subunit E [Candidatus Aenigmatarchaeota archaeon]|nr:MAG: Glu-tRNA(Gln) amidotransferase GatDE subunit E [Candidatus Aenigmarchaeota archaeon]
MKIKCGIEIHQQLLTHKLFCPCSSGMHEKPQLEIVRRLRPVPGELGDVDVAAQYEFLRNRVFAYKHYPNESCLVELDEEPPHQLNPEALETAVMIALMLNCDIPDEIHIMRKIVIDGSDTTGFQRTALIGMNGWIKTSFGKVGIKSVCLEEESAQILGRKAGKPELVTYGLNRFGIPLVEIGTQPDITNFEEARETAEKLGMILRSTQRVKTGLGTIRQDLNISIPGGVRVEIKGVQSLSLIPKVLEFEAKRQESLLKAGEKPRPEVRKANPDGTTEFLRPLPGAARLYPETDCPPVRIDRSWLDALKLKLPELLDEKIKRWVEGYKLSWELASQLARSDKAGLFEYLIQWADPKLVANVLVNVLKGLKREGVGIEKLEARHFRFVFEALREERIAKEGIPELLKKFAENPQARIEELVSETLGPEEVKRLVKKILKEKPELRELRNPFQAYMGLVMKQVRGRAPGSLIAKILKEELSE